MRYFSIVILSVILNCTSLVAQYNSDCLDVKRKKIKTATAYSFDEWGDSMFYRCTYDMDGRVIKTSYYGKNRGEFTYYYSPSGRIIGFTDVFISAVEIALPNPTGKSIRFDTGSVTIERFNELTGKLEYYLNLNYDNNGKRSAGSMTKVNGDTTCYYFIHHDEFSLQEFTIRSKIDTLKRGYYETYYHLRCDAPEHQGEPDTSSWACVYILDRRGWPVKYYTVWSPEELPRYIGQSDGHLYSPIEDTLSYLQLAHSSKNVYRKDGSLEYTIQTNPRTKETQRIEPPQSPFQWPIHPIESLKVVEEYGPTTFEYYE